jgi:Type II CAAX prenyl endopeptidase Rce1-like
MCRPPSAGTTTSGTCGRSTLEPLVPASGNRVRHDTLSDAVMCLPVASFGFGEEIGWRGFTLPRLQRNHSALGVLASRRVVWAIWHPPAFWYLPTYMQLGLPGFPILTVSLAARVNSPDLALQQHQGSVLAVAVWHGLYDFRTAAKPSEGVIVNDDPHCRLGYHGCRYFRPGESLANG